MAEVNLCINCGIAWERSSDDPIDPSPGVDREITGHGVYDAICNNCACATCNGTGRKLDEPCSNCQGLGIPGAPIPGESRNPFIK